MIVNKMMTLETVQRSMTASGQSGTKRRNSGEFQTIRTAAATTTTIPNRSVFNKYPTYSHGRAASGKMEEYSENWFEPAPHIC